MRTIEIFELVPPRTAQLVRPNRGQGEETKGESRDGPRIILFRDTDHHPERLKIGNDRLPPAPRRLERFAEPLGRVDLHLPFGDREPEDARYPLKNAFGRLDRTARLDLAQHCENERRREFCDRQIADRGKYIPCQSRATRSKVWRDASRLA
ncbi:MAG: hypothetical protein V4472_01290 [Pseudomonadota bacterium]